MQIFLPRMMFIKECSKLLLFAIIFTGKIYYSEAYVLVLIHERLRAHDQGTRHFMCVNTKVSLGAI